MKRTLAVLALCVAGCHPAANEPAAPENAAGPPATAPSAGSHKSNGPAAVRAPVAIAEQQTLAEWGKAKNRSSCAPLAFTDNGGAAADPRAAAFSGGWAIAFDQPRMRSLYGVAGTGVAIDGPNVEVAKLRAQWPLVRALDGKAGRLPEGAMAGYGVEGAAAYPPANPDGAGLQSLAYVVIPGQQCLYNVWSRLGRRHLETLLDGLTLLQGG